MKFQLINAGRRIPVPAELVKWDVKWDAVVAGDEYNPPWFDHQLSRKDDLTLTEVEVEASFEKDVEGGGNLLLPLNPSGRTGLEGRGTLWKWGPNHAVDRWPSEVEKCHRCSQGGAERAPPLFEARSGL